MAEINIELNEEKIEQEIVQAVINSAIGSQINKSIEAVLTQKGGPYNMDRLLERSIQSEIERIVVVIIRNIIEENKDAIRKVVETELTDETILRLSSAALECILEKCR